MIIDGTGINVNAKAMAMGTAASTGGLGRGLRAAHEAHDEKTAAFHAGKREAEP